MTADLTTLPTSALLDELRQRKRVIVKAFAPDGAMMPIYIQGPCTLVLVQHIVESTEVAASAADPVSAL